MDVDVNLIFLENLDSLNQAILDLLNQGGSPQLVLEKTRAQHSLFGNNDEKRRAQIVDVTGDQIPELLIAPGLFVSIFSCENGQYRVLLSQTTQSVQEMDIRAIVDANKNGIPEVYIYIAECLGGKCNRLMVFEWDGRSLEYVILDSVFSSKNPYQYCDDIHVPFELSFHDVDGDGLNELILTGQPLFWLDDLRFPYRDETRICKWNGKGFVFYQKAFSEPIYRFQAVQDADLAAAQGEDDKAMKLYHRSISDDSLEWWSIERRFVDFWTMHADFYHQPTPTPSPPLNPDPAEYPSLAAYSYYRIMLLHARQGNRVETATVYRTLLETFEDDPYARRYVEMATAFWKSYEATRKVEMACASAIDYAENHPEILTPLGDSYHGMQSHTYAPEDVCPFR